MKTGHSLAFGRATLAVLIIVSAGWAVTPNSVTIPGAARGAEGNSDNLYPFNGDAMRYQQVTSAAEFPQGGRWITRIALRPDTASGGAFTGALANVQINLSTTAKGPSTLSKTFADNIGTDDQVVQSGELALSSAFTGPAGGPKDFDIIITLQGPFYYDPSAGNLLLDVRNYSGEKTTQLDAHDAPDSTGRVWNDGADSPAATKNDPFPSAGLVICFISD